MRRENTISKREKITKFNKFKLVYASKSNSNFIGQKIGKRTHILTPNRASNDPIHFQIKDFHSVF